MRHLFVSILLIAFLLPAFRNNPEGGAVLTWRKGQILQWKDFKGKPKKTNSVASTSYDILKEVRKINGIIMVEVRAVFYPFKSWRLKERNDLIILIHEQKHFDIAELFARKLRKKIMGENFSDKSDLDKKLHLIYDLNDAELDAYQDNYDNETDHSRNIPKQKEWNKKIEKELAESENFAQTNIKINFRPYGKK